MPRTVAHDTSHVCKFSSSNLLSYHTDIVYWIGKLLRARPPMSLYLQLSEIVAVTLNFTTKTKTTDAMKLTSIIHNFDTSRLGAHNDHKNVVYIVCRPGNQLAEILEDYVTTLTPNN